MLTLNRTGDRHRIHPYALRVVLADRTPGYIGRRRAPEPVATTFSPVSLLRSALAR